ncbi:MAG: pilus assembly protein TadG-related protein [Hyphomicrobiales bacterium]
MVYEAIQTRTKQWIRDDAGVTAITTALGLSILLALIALAIDTGAGEASKQRLQRGLDAGTLSVAATPDLAEDPVAASKLLDGYLRTALDQSTYARLRSSGISVLTDPKTGKKTIVGTAKMDSDSLFGSFNPAADASIEVVSKAAPNGFSRPLEVAIVIDTTTSMGLTPPGERSSALNLLKQSVSQFVDSIAGPNTKIALVPFSDQVCLPDKYWKDIAGNPRKDLPDWLLPPANRRDSSGKIVAWDGCIGHREKSLVTTISEASSAPYPATSRNWFDKTSVASNSTQPIVALTTDKAQVLKSVNSLSAMGMTYVPAGLVWAWNALTPEAPMTEASPSGSARKVIVLFSDVENTRVTYDVPRSSPNFGKTTTGFVGASSNPEMLQTCDSIKKAGIELVVFWYQMRNSSADYVSKLSSCASKPEYFISADPRVQGDFTAKFSTVKSLLASDGLRLTQ